MTADVLVAVAAVCLACAAVPAVLFLVNLRLFRPPPVPGRDPGPVSVLIPARDEEAAIEGAVRAALASRGVEVEVVVLDDGSTDRTAEIVRALAAADPRVRLESAPPLPAGWNGKQHACWQLARLARHRVLCFVDADVRLAPDAVARAAGLLRDPGCGTEGCGLVSGFPRQATESWLERLAIPLIHFVLLGFLPLGWMRRSLSPAFGAGCGQWMVADRDDYLRAGGHAAIRATLHDGLRLPRAFRAAGIRTDLFDATGLAVCRMYRDAAGVWNGLAKNAGEGLGAPAAIVPWTLLLGLGQVAPPVLLAVALAAPAAAGIGPLVAPVAAAATALAYLPRLVAVWRLRQPLSGALAHPAGVAVLLAIQWHALVRRALGRPSSWKGRRYLSTATPPPPAPPAVEETASHARMVRPPGGLPGIAQPESE